MNEIAAPVVAGLSKADDTMKDKIREEVYKSLNQKYPDGNILVDSSALIIYGEK